MKSQWIKLVNNQKGFTFIEIISVLIILGVLAITISSRLTVNQSDLLSIKSSLVSHIQYAQFKSMQSDTNLWGIRIDSAIDEYWLFRCDMGQSCAFGSNRVPLPGQSTSSPSIGGNRIKTSLMNVDIASITTGSSMSKLTIVWDNAGVPFITDGNSFTADYLTPGSTTPEILDESILIGLTDSSGNSRTITILKETGFIQ
jgi:prepilin-type N-terminal cleavage/methylation domain-containing protein